MAQVVGYLPEATPGTDVVIYKFKSTGLGALILETADFLRDEAKLGRRHTVLAFREDSDRLCFDMKEEK